MKRFANVQDWLNTDPPIEVTSVVLYAINRSSISYYKKELHKKNNELKKLEMAISTMKDAKLAVPLDLTDSADALRRAISNLEDQLPKPK